MNSTENWTELTRKWEINHELVQVKTTNFI